MNVELVLAYLGLFAASFLAATVLPLSSEAALATLVYREQTLLLPLLVATAGNFLGACTTYWLGRRAAQTIAARRGRELAQGRAGRLLRRYGAPVLALSWVPLLGDALVALAGATRMPFGAFALWVLAGKALRYLAVGWAAYQVAHG